MCRRALPWMVLLLGLLSRTAFAQEAVKPYFVVIVDNSGSMNDKVADGLNSCGQERSRMSDAKCAMQRVVNAYGDATFALARFQETTSGTCTGPVAGENQAAACDLDTCPSGSGCDRWRFETISRPGPDPTGPWCGDCEGKECTDRCDFFECNSAENYSCPATCTSCDYTTLDCGDCNESTGASCPATGSNADRGEILVPFGEENQDEIVKWVDFSCDTCDVTGSDPELGAETFTPLAGALRGARRYYQGNDPRFPGSPIGTDPYKACRPYRVILLTDGDESCAAYSQGPVAATELRTTPVTVGGTTTNYDIRTYTIGFDLTTGASGRLSSIAANGGTTTTYSAADETSIALAFSQIIEDSILVEICDGDDDDCDGLIDEGFTKYCNRPAGITTATLCADPGDPCDGVDDNCFDGINDEVTNACGTCGPTPAEVCDTIDNDCDGFINEGNVCGGCVPQAEVCDGMDNDCDGMEDEGLTRTCGSDVGACELGVEMCDAGAWVGCTGTLGTTETCNNIDDDCDGVVDGMAEQCGFPDVGECDPGNRVCTAGEWGMCTGGHGPTTEICDLLDNDCDGTVDDGATGTGVDCNTTCGAGTTACVAGELVCVGGGVGSPETCNGADDDCDGVIDNGLPSMGACTEDGALCVPGELLCVEGSYQCVGGSPPGTEVCDCVDNDCDASIDEGDLCGPQAACLAGPYCGCARHCTNEEFPCPLGFSCTDPANPLDGFCVPDECATISCPPVAGVAQVCVDGGCVDACSQVSCTPPFICRGSDGVCVPDSCSFFPDRCTAEEVCIDDDCVSNPCATVTCGADVCADGTCVPSCAGVDCPEGERCTRGNCAVNPCADVYCPEGRACHPDTGACVEDFCDIVVCRAGQTCDPVTGDCVQDPCALVDCPEAQVCSQGDCFFPSDLQPPVPPEFVSAAGGGGFECAVSPGARGGNGGGAWWLLAIAGVAVAMRRRTRVVLTLLAVVALATVAGCKSDGYCVTCGLNNDGGDDDGDGGSSFDGLVNRDATINDACLPNGLEVCDGFDNDCDGQIDEGTLADVGVACGTDEGPCEPGRTVCEDGHIVCGEGAVSPSPEDCDGVDNDCDGVVDDGDPGGSATCGDTVGECSPGLTRCVGGAIACEGGIQPGTESCNGRDDDCDGVIDDGNPGGGVPCGVGVGTCAPGTTRCAGGSIVCEGAGTPTIESCDGFDNDCDTFTDEDFNTTNDPRNCGACGNSCAGTVLNARATCAASTCVVESCNTDYWNLDGDNAPSDILGCEYHCELRGVEICNGLDDDCDGQTDEGLTAPAICNNVGSCAGTVASCDGDEGWVCHYPAIVQVDVLGGIVPEGDCDNVDNDCDGVADDSFTLKGDPCTRGLGACTTNGSYICNAAHTDVQCNAATPPAGTTEICDGIDNDCDGTDDEGAADTWTQFTLSGGGNRWIYRYEASRPDATAASKGARTHRPCSQANKLPWTNVTQPQAEAACTAIGARLCSETEWQRACQTSAATACEWSYSAMCTTYNDTRCNGNDYDFSAATVGDQDGVLASGALAECRSVWTGGNIYDLSGNVKEWTAERSAGINPLRGGSYNNTGGGMQCDFNFLVADDTFQFENVGFRCCRSTAP